MYQPQRFSIELRDIGSSLEVLRRLHEITSEEISIYDDGVPIATIHPVDASGAENISADFETFRTAVIAQRRRISSDHLLGNRYRPWRATDGGLERTPAPKALEDRVNDLITAPAGCAFLLIAEAMASSAQEAASPAVSLAIAGAALDEVTIWRGDHEENVRSLLSEGERLRDYARTLLARTDTAWWWEPLDRRAQLWVAPADQLDAPPHPEIPKRFPSRWEQYAQKPDWGIFTSTEIGGTCSRLNARGDLWSDLKPPLVRYRLTVRDSARVFEVTSPEDWHYLCASYPDPGLDAPLVPDFAAVARDWDGVHLTLGGLLTAEQVRISGPSGWSGHWGWDAEQTLWLRWVFDEAIRLPDIIARPEPRWYLPPRPEASR